MRGSLALLATAVIFSASSALAAECSCVSRGGNISRTSQSGSGICSTAQAGSSCAVQALQAPMAGQSPRIGNRPRLDEALTRSGVSLDAAEAVSIGATTRPEQWPQDRFAEVATALFALSQAGSGGGELGAIHEQLSRNRDILMPLFAGPMHRTAQQIPLGPYQATVSYGCIELERGDFLAKMRTPFSEATNRCGDFG